jgi:type I restriction enzyme S subunit
MSSRGWNIWKIGDIGRIVTGKTPPTQNLNNFGDRYPFITPRDMLGQKRIQKTERYLSEEGKTTVKNCLLPANSICVSCIGSDMGKVVMTTTDSVTNQQLNSVICKASFDPDFVYYALLNISDELRNVGHHSTAVPILNKTDFSNFEITAPDTVTQHRIAAILSALDEKIELNHQTNATLETIAQAIFKEWFVDFNFPGATSEMVESKLGMIPRGWRVGSFRDILNNEIGGDWGEDNSFEGSVPAISLRGTDLEKLKSFGYAPEAPLRWVKGSSLEKRKLTSKDILIAGSGLGPIGRSIYYASILQDIYAYPIIYSNFCKKLRAETPAYAIYAERLLELIYINGEMRQFFTGTSIPNLDIQSLLAYKIIIPQADILEEYYKRIGKAKFGFLFNPENIYLTQIRDGLLPKLMSGEIEV